MITLDETMIARPIDVSVSEELLTAELEDGRIISVPTAWFPRLVHGTPAERQNWTLSRFGIHWESLDEDISIEGLIAGQPSNENPEMIKKWIKTRENVYEIKPHQHQAVAEESKEYTTKENKS